MRKTNLLVAAAVGSVVLIGVGAWFGVRTFTATRALAGTADNAPGMMTGAKGRGAMFCLWHKPDIPRATECLLSGK
jgi:hypothetical protein